MKKKTPVVSIIFFVVGAILVVVSVFMLTMAIGYTKTYLQSYDASFSDMWTNSLQYIIETFLPYAGLGAVCIGIGLAIREMKHLGTIAEMSEKEPEHVPAPAPAANTVPEATQTSEPAPEKEGYPDYTDAIGRLEAGIAHLTNDVNATREVLSIKIEEKEKRDAYRIRGLGIDVMTAIESDYQPEGTSDPTTAEPATLEPIKLDIPIAPTKPVPIFTVSRSMAMPDVPEVIESVETEAKTIPLFTVSRTMAMPDIDFI